MCVSAQLSLKSGMSFPGQDTPDSNRDHMALNVAELDGRIKENNLNGFFPEFSVFLIKNSLLAYLSMTRIGQGERPRAPVQVSLKKRRKNDDFISKIAIRVC